ncbi:hypothetical protein FB567DRAFT_617337 [Paraphoma chrysanthemicola]|uniref:Uncharacterized protein n=1 Tax=Paraphoma chrysanthemicola TaxID=798071 RepID=A0A8K0RFM0_9PLEO|nr:hypothetical protein FB567DRAFT_617337 [Paraphoma chrysanthemicola]
MATQDRIISGANLRAALAKLQRTGARRKELSQKEQAIDEEKAKLQQQLLWLETKRKLLHGQYNEYLHDAYEHSIVPFAKAWNLKFAVEMQARLPRELRDMIYTFFWDSHSFDSDFYTTEVACGNDYRNEHHLLHCVDCHHMAHVLSPVYMGSETALEMVQTLYKSFNEDGLTVWSPASIHRAISTDCFHVGFAVAKTTIRKLSIHCKLDLYRTPPQRHELTDKCNHTAADLSFIKGQVLEQQFKNLLAIEDKRDFDLHILIIQRNIRLDALAEAIEALREVRKTFTEASGKVDVVWTYRGNWVEGEPPSDIDLLVLPINGFFDKGRNEWGPEMKQFLRMYDDVIVPKHDRLHDDHLFAKSRDINGRVHSMWGLNEDEYSTGDEESSEDEDGDTDFEEES